MVSHKPLVLGVILKSYLFLVLCVTVRSGFADRTRFRGKSATHKAVSRHGGHRVGSTFNGRFEVMKCPVGENTISCSRRPDVRMAVCVRVLLRAVKDSQFLSLELQSSARVSLYSSSCGNEPKPCSLSSWAV